MIKLTTSLGSILIELNEEKAPISAENFKQYVKDGFYDGTLFHRVIQGFMIQGGGMNEEMVAKPTRETIENEANNGLKNEIGSIAMARTSAPHSASSQFFINTANNSFLDYPGQDGWGYCVFGLVKEGMDVVQKI
jgi:peptidyl-prolyl cis-trans isomerase B (cyclophilin B)